MKEPTPFPLQDLQKIHIYQDGVDVGIIPLPDFYRDSLKSNDIVPVTVGGWKGNAPLPCDAYALLGLPEEKQIGISVQLTLTGLKPAPVPEHYILSKIPRFCAVRLDDDGLDSVSGMSGGPIFGMRKTKEAKGEYTCTRYRGRNSSSAGWCSARR